MTRIMFNIHSGQCVPYVLANMPIYQYANLRSFGLRLHDFDDFFHYNIKAKLQTLQFKYKQINKYFLNL